MAKLIYLMLLSLDGYMEDSQGNFDWAAPDVEVHTYINDLMRPVGVYLYGRRMYEVMTAWETMPALATGAPYAQEFAQLWQAAEKAVYSRTLDSVVTGRTRIEREYNPESVRQMKAASSADLAVGGPELASQMFSDGLVDECLLFLAPVIVGGGKRALPGDLAMKLDLLNEQRFNNGMVYLHYRVDH